MRALALDLVLTSTGVCHPDGTTEVLKTDAMRGMKRLAYIRDRVVKWAAYVDLPDVVVIEGYSFASTGRAGISLGELGGVIRLALLERDIPFVEIPPTCRAKYATGKGNAGKSLVVSCATYRAQRVFPTDDEADAWVLWQMALAHYEPESPLLVKVPAVNREGLNKVQWPQIEMEGKP
jgi:Holliday junction resolvasome RuvABC endonuclease subunit